MTSMMWCTALYGVASYLFNLVFNGFVFRKLRFMTEIDSVATRRAVAFLKDRRGTMFTTALANEDDTVPIDWMVNLRDGWIALSVITVGQRRWGEEHATDLIVWVPRWWRTLPPELVVGPSRPVDAALTLTRVGTVELKVMKKLPSSYCAWMRGAKPFTIHKCPRAAHVAAEAMRVAVEAQANRVFYVNGPPDTGKTTSAMILAHLMGGIYVDSYDFANPSHKFDVLLEHAKPCPGCPLVVSVNEADDKIARVLRKNRKNQDKDTDTDTADCSEYGPADVHDKGTLNNLLDRVNHQDEDVIFVLSGNTPFRRLVARFGDDASITKPTRISVVNVGGDAEYDREPEEGARDAEKVARDAEEDADATLADPVPVSTPSIFSECSEGTGSESE
jgi:hypothetical protein